MTVPFLPEVEAAVLGSCLGSLKRAQTALASLRNDDVYSPGHSAVLRALRVLAQAGARPDRASVLAEVTRAGSLGMLEGGAAFLQRLEAAAEPMSLDHHCRLLRDASARRAVMAVCSEAIEAAKRGDAATSLVERLASEAVRISTGKADDLTQIGAVLPGVLADLDRRAQSNAEGRAVTGVRTGVTQIDEMTTGFQPEWLVVIAALPGGGKSALAVQTALTLCLEDGGTALVFNTEMSRAELAERTLAHVGRMNTMLLRRGQVTLEDKERLKRVADRIGKTRLYLETDTLDYDDIRGKARAWRAKHPTDRGLVVVDYIQMLEADSDVREDDVKRIKRMANGFKRLAKELKVPIIMVSQLNRVGAKNIDGPTMHDLEGSSAIEKAADVIFLGHNPGQTEDGPVQWLCPKFRHGRAYKCNAWWTGRHLRFSDTEPDRRPGDEQ